MSFEKKYQFVWLLALAVVVFSCGKDSACFKGTGGIVQEQRVATNQITSIITEDNIDIIITQSNVASLILEGGANLLPYIKTEISGAVLSISSDNRCGMFRDNTIPITVYLSIPNLTHIDYTGQGVVSSSNKLNFPFFEIDSRGGSGSFILDMDVQELAIKQHSGPADFTFSGKVDNLYVYTLGQGWFYLDDLISKNIHVNHSGIGDVFVNVKNELSVEMRSRGSVYYTGSPIVSVGPKLGIGSVEKR